MQEKSRFPTFSETPIITPAAKRSEIWWLLFWFPVRRALTRRYLFTLTMLRRAVLPDEELLML